MPVCCARLLEKMHVLTYLMHISTIGLNVDDCSVFLRDKLNSIPRLKSNTEFCTSLGT